MKTKNKPKASDLFEFAPTKAQEQQLKIIEAAIASFSINGIEKTTYTNLAKTCGISRPLINHYFPTLDDLFLLTAKYVRRNLLNLAMEELEKVKSKNPQEQIQGYFKGCIRWVKEHPHQCSFWFLYFYQASRNKKNRIENTKLVEAGHKRLQDILEFGNESGFWKIENSMMVAKLVQVTITGAMVSCMSEDGYLTPNKAEDMIGQFLTQLKLTF